MKNTIRLFKTVAACAAFAFAITAYTSCANSTSATGSDTTDVRTAPAAADTMSAPSSAVTPDTATNRKDSM